LRIKRLDAGLLPQRPRFVPRSVHVGFVVDKVALGRFISEFFGFPPASHHSVIAPYSSITVP
jgi:hypothetical protein